MTSPSLEYCRHLSKAELHAHLNGSISIDTMAVLLDMKSKKLKLQGKKDTIPEMWQVVIKKGEQRQLDSAFEMFKIIHSVVDNEEALVTVACDVVKEFAEDNVKYLELRTTPRPNIESGMTKQSYIDAVISGIQKAIPLCTNDIDVRLLLSIDRRQSVSEAYDTLKLAHSYSTLSDGVQGRVVGIDLSGDPKAGNTHEIVSVLEEAKRQGLKLSVHIAERPDREEDSELLLTVSPDRIGHATFLHLGPQGISSPAVQSVLDNRIPIEICLTSNIKARTVSSYDQHQLKFWRDKGHPCVISTDDKGVFATSLSEEYHIAAETFGLTDKDLCQMGRESFQYAFEKI